MKYLKEFNFRRGYITYPRLVVVVGVHAEGKRNLMPAVWNTPLSFDPPLYGVSIAPKRYTHDLILKSMQFSVCFFPYRLSDLVEALGSVSGRDVDKFSKYGIETLPSVELDVPVPKDAYAVLECEYVEHKQFGDHTLFVGEVKVIHYNEDVCTEAYGMPILDLFKEKPVLYAGRGSYVTVDSSSLKKLR